MQTSEENRTDKLQGFFKAITEAQRAIMPIINRCLEGMDTAAGICDAKKVCGICCLYKSSLLPTTLRPKYFPD